MFEVNWFNFSSNGINTFAQCDFQLGNLWVITGEGENTLRFNWMHFSAIGFDRLRFLSIKVTVILANYI